MILFMTRSHLGIYGPMGLFSDSVFWFLQLIGVIVLLAAFYYLT